MTETIQPAPAPLVEAATVEPNLAGVGAAGAAVTEMVSGWGLPWAAERAERAAHLLAQWLIRHGGENGPITIRATFGARDRHLQIEACDTGRRLPTPDNAGSLRIALAEVCQHHWSAYTDTGRALVCALKVRRAYRIRLARVPCALGAQARCYPQYVHLEFDERADAEQAGTREAARLGHVYEARELAAVEIQSPDDAHEASSSIGLREEAR